MAGGWRSVRGMLSSASWRSAVRAVGVVAGSSWRSDGALSANDGRLFPLMIFGIMVGGVGRRMTSTTMRRRSGLPAPDDWLGSLLSASRRDLSKASARKQGQGVAIERGKTGYASGGMQEKDPPVRRAA